MKKSNQVILSAILAMAIASCKDKTPEDEWSDGKDAYGNTRDTVIRHGNTGYMYRYFHGGWFPLQYGLINVGRYRPAAISEIARPGYTPRVQVRTPGSAGFRSGGFGSSSRTVGA